MSIDRDRQRALVAARGADRAGELGEDEAAVGEPGQRVLEEQRLEALGLHDELLLEHLRAPGRLDAGDQLGVADRLDEEVLRAAAQRGDGGVEVEVGALEQHDRAAVGLRVALERGQQRLLVVAAQLDVHEHHVRRLLAAALDGRVGGRRRPSTSWPDVREHAGEAAPDPGVGMGEDHLHCSRDYPQVARRYPGRRCIGVLTPAASRTSGARAARR